MAARACQAAAASTWRPLCCSHTALCQARRAPRTGHRSLAASAKRSKKGTERAGVTGVHDSVAELRRAFRPTPIKLVCVAKGGAGPAQAVCAEYFEKIARYAPSFEEVTIRPNPKGSRDVEQQVTGEADKILKAIDGADMVVALDERGRDATSEGFAELIARAGDDGARSLVFCIGGPYGLSQAVRDRADVVWRLSACVLNHSVARIVLAEQLYRGYTILRGEPYHH